MIFGYRLKERRKELGMTQQELAKKSRVYGNSIGHYEAGRCEPTLDSARCLAQALEVSIDYLAGLTNEK